jgi:hypothetical protein
MLLPCCWEVGCLAGVSRRGLGRKKPPQVSRVLRGNSGRSNSSGEFFLETDARKKLSGFFGRDFPGDRVPIGEELEQANISLNIHRAKLLWPKWRHLTTPGGGGGLLFRWLSWREGATSPNPIAREWGDPETKPKRPPSPPDWPPSVHNRTVADKISGTRLTYMPIGIY